MGAFIMMINEIIARELKNPEFAKEYESEGKKLQRDVTLYKMREEANQRKNERSDKNSKYVEKF